MSLNLEQLQNRIEIAIRLTRQGFLTVEEGKAQVADLRKAIELWHATSF